LRKSGQQQKSRPEIIDLCCIFIIVSNAIKIIALLRPIEFATFFLNFLFLAFVPPPPFSFLLTYLFCLVGAVSGAIHFIAKFSFFYAIEFDPEVFYYVLLPIIIFESGYSMKKRGIFFPVYEIYIFLS
jgi:hypothetical protein